MATNTTIAWTVVAACLTSLGAATAEEKEEAGAKLYWIFLTTGKSTQGVPADDVRKMQAAHLANFGRLADEGKLLTAGPMRDPEGVLRGIVIVKASNRSAVDRMFDQDPYVEEGYMKVEAYEARMDRGAFVANIRPESLEELRIVIASDPKEANDSVYELPEGQAEYAAKLWDEGTILLASTFVGQGTRRFVWITKDHDNLQRLVEASPAVAGGGFAYRIIPLYLGKGSLARGK